MFVYDVFVQVSQDPTRVEESRYETFGTREEATSFAEEMASRFPEGLVLLYVYVADPAADEPP